MCRAIWSSLQQPKHGAPRVSAQPTVQAQQSRSEMTRCLHSYIAKIELKYNRAQGGGNGHGLQKGEGGRKETIVHKIRIIA